MADTKITIEQITKIARLSAIVLDKEQINAFIPDIENILSWIRQIEQIDIASAMNEQKEKSLLTFSDGEQIENNIAVEKNQKLRNGYFFTPKFVEEN